MTTITKAINIIRSEWRGMQSSTRLLLKLGSYLLLVSWLLGWASNIVEAYDGGRFVRTYPAAAFAIIGVLTATALVLLVTVARIIPVVWPAIRRQTPWRQVVRQVLRYWVVGRTWLHGSVVLGAALLAFVVVLDGGHNSLAEPRWLQITAFTVVAFYVGQVVGRVRQYRRHIRNEDDVCHPCDGLNHLGCDEVEDGDVRFEDGTVERLCCCGIPVATRPSALNPNLTERV